MDDAGQSAWGSLLNTFQMLSLGPYSLVLILGPVPTPALNQTPLLTDISFHTSLWLRHQRPHQQHHDYPPGPEAAAQQV